MPKYYKDIYNQTPLTEELVWSQSKVDHNLKDTDITPKVREALDTLIQEIIDNRTNTTKLGIRVITEYRLRNRIKKLFMESILTGDDLVEEIMQDIAGRKES